uniref:Uncharacterized protein n=1 Tax=Cucumis melo TaxID=3656 RepID=A0A9I9ECY4_CUCME
MLGKERRREILPNFRRRSTISRARKVEDRDDELRKKGYDGHDPFGIKPELPKWKELNPFDPTLSLAYSFPTSGGSLSFPLGQGSKGPVKTNILSYGADLRPDWTQVGKAGSQPISPIKHQSQQAFYLSHP